MSAIRAAPRMGRATSWCASSAITRARAGLLAPQVGEEWGGQGLCHREIATVLRASGYSMLGPIAMNCMAPDEGNMHLLERVATPAQKERFLRPLAAGEVRSAFLMTEPDGGAGSDPSMLRTTARQDGSDWVIFGSQVADHGRAWRGVRHHHGANRTGGDDVSRRHELRRASSSSACSTRSTSRCRAGTRSSRSTTSA